MENIICKKEELKLYKIGMFAQMNRVSIKTLRYYDDIGLLKAEKVDEINGYRYYSSSQMPILHKILALRDMNFSIEEIQLVFQGKSEEQLLSRKKQELLVELSNITKKIAGIESYLMSDYVKSNYHVVMKSLPRVSIAYMKLHLNSYEELFYKMPDMGALMEKAGCECLNPGYCFTIYFDGEYRESNINAQICEEVTSVKENQGELYFEELEEVELAACVLHKGSYQGLPKAYAAVVRFIEESGYEICGYQRESYIDGVWNQEDEKDWLTEIQFPVRKMKTMDDFEGA
ncbi:MerR family transcriptional regulator [Amedibacillus sp. YH-ame6]